MADVAVHLRVRGGQAGAARAVIAEEAEALGVGLTAAFKAIVPRRSGKTAESIRMEPLVAVGPIWRLRFRGHFTIRFLISGAKPHLEHPRPRTGAGHGPELRMNAGGAWVFTSEVHHPGMHKTGLIGKALDRVVPGAVVHMKRRMGEAIASDLRAAIQ